MTGMKKQSERFAEILRLAGKAKLPQQACHDADGQLAQKVVKVYGDIMKPKGNYDRLTDNVASLLQSVRENKSLRTIEPLYLYRVLTRHTQRLQKGDAPQFDMNALWHYQYYQLEENNGKNYKTCLRYLSLFEALYYMFKDESDVDKELCLYGFDHLSNLGKFYRALNDDNAALDFAPEIDDIFLKFPLSCFERGYGDNVILESSGLSVTEFPRTT